MKKAQENDPIYGKYYQNPIQGYIKHNGLLYFQRIEKGTLTSYLVLPIIFIQPLVNMKHYSIYSNHHSLTWILREIKKTYYTSLSHLKEVVRKTMASCFTCQNLQNIPKPQAFQRFDKVTAPRTTWAVDIVTNMPKSPDGNTAIFIAIDMFTCYIQAVPIKSKSTGCIKQAIIDTIIRPFGPFNILRCDNEAGIQNSAEFTEFSKDYGFEIIPTSTAAPWSNGAAERAVQSIKKAMKSFLIHEQRIKVWDQHIHDITYAHNNCVGKYNFSPEEIHFGYKNPSRTEILQFYPEELTQEQYMDSIIQLAENKRQQMRQMSAQHNEQKMTQRNQNRFQKKFREGDVVIQRQAQVAVGPHSSIQTKFTGPYVIKKIDERDKSALVENMKTKRCSKSHFTWLEHYRFNPAQNRLPHDFESQLLNQSLSGEPRDRLPSPPPSQPDPDSQDGADDQDFMDDPDMFHSTKTQQSRRQRYLDQHTQSQQTQTTPPQDNILDQSSEPIQRSSPLGLQDDFQVTDYDDGFNIQTQDSQPQGSQDFVPDPKSQDQAPTNEQPSNSLIEDDDFIMHLGEPRSRRHRMDESDDDDLLIDCIQPQQKQAQPKDIITEQPKQTQDSNDNDNILSQTTKEQTDIQPTQSPSQFGPSQLPLKKRPLRKKAKLIVKIPEGTQPIIDIINKRNQHTFTQEMDDDTLTTLDTQPTPYQPNLADSQLTDEFSSLQTPQGTPNRKRKLIVKFQPDEDQPTITDRITKKPKMARQPPRQQKPRPQPTHSYQTRSKTTTQHGYSTRSKDKT